MNRRRISDRAQRKLRDRVQRKQLGKALAERGVPLPPPGRRPSVAERVRAQTAARAGQQQLPEGPRVEVVER